MLLGFILVLAVALVALLAEAIAPQDPTLLNMDALLAPPGPNHLFGTDELGRDIFSRVVHGTRYALLIGVAVVLIEALIGIVLGATAAYFGGWADAVLMRVVDVMLAVPTLVLALAIAGVLGGGLGNMILAIGVTGWREFARLIRGQVLVIRTATYVEAARALGAGDLRVLARHVLPNALGTAIVYTTLEMPAALLWAASLSFLGLGAQPPTPEWGAMVAEGRGFIGQAWWVSTFPGLAIMITVLGFNFLGDGLRDLLDPRTARVL
ncbi:MAG: ABC transporter permease [Armatimonadota bacterium]|nr:ABC transporter permease [Armatimonadota bacterium]MDR7452448.1 ABC transporter permease [Armatimonadota bacterium]MDR7466186.1 ABC transporter permease [Armatimonadota bacterium]MDR7495131.1 ABC transporter permease [Armatimonadota bacterium]MDR7505799.1 ABC transporter permease [Armatimonadota bacterium]